VADKKKMEEKVLMDKLIPKSMSNEEKEKFLNKVNHSTNRRGWNLILFVKHRDIFSLDKNNIGWATNLKHRIDLNNKESTYKKQFPIPDAHRSKLETEVNKWLKMGLIQLSWFRYNCPIYLLAKKDGSFKVVQDYRELNAKGWMTRYSMKDVNECIRKMLFLFSRIKANLGRIMLGGVVLDDHIAKVLEWGLILVLNRLGLHLKWFIEVVRITVLSFA
jgi:hypothetical protein